MKRQGNNPKRRVAQMNAFTQEHLDALANKIKYMGSGHHKRFPADYGMERTNPRPTKSLCDLVRVIKFEEATALLKSGISKGLISEYQYDGFPKFVWCVDTDGQVYEAKSDPNTPSIYHGYPLEEEDAMREIVQAEWKSRCH